MHDVPAGELGEIVHRSPQLLSSYWDKPEETAEAFRGGWFHSGDLEAVTAVVVLRDGHSATADEIVAHVHSMLASYKVPKRVVFVDELPKNASGKILKRDLRATFGDSG